MTGEGFEQGFEHAASWLRWLYGETFDGRIWIGGHISWRGQVFEDAFAAAHYAVTMDRAGQGIDGVYHRLTTVGQVGTGRRGQDEDSVILPAVTLDLDIAGPGHKKLSLPATLDDLSRVIDDAGLPAPTAWVHSGGGAYPIWRLAEPLALTRDGETFAFGQEALRTIQRAVREAGAACGWELDNTSDLARVYRLPGTTNRKGDAPVMARWELGTGVDHEIGALLAGLKRPVSVPVSAPQALSASTPEAFSATLGADGGEGWMGGLAGMFGQPVERSGPRTFTLAEAMAFVTPKLDALRTARDGEINVRLNEAACALAHFGTEFWDESAADAQLYRALENTAYDGMTWKAGDTIASARKAMTDDWRAILVPTPEQALEHAVVAAPMDAVDALLAEMLAPEQIIERPPPRYLIHDLLQMDSESWLIGPPGSKKSFVVLDMATAVLRGAPWQGLDTHPADVVMIVAEGAGGMGKRLKAWQLEHGPIPPGLRILPRPVQASRPEAWGVLVAACARLANAARERDRGLLVVLDTQARVSVGMKENDATDMGVFIAAVSAIREHTGGCVLTVHHTGRTGGDARGSSAIDGAQTTELKIIPRGKFTARLSVEKQKDIEEVDPMDIAFKRVVIGQDERGRDITSLVMADRDSADFRAAWAGAEMTAEGIEADEVAKVTPFKARTSVDRWIVDEVDGRAVVQHWIVQALVDTAETLGLTQSEVRGLVEEKRGKVDNSTWRKAWQKVADESGQWGRVVRSAGGQRWTVDRVAIEGAGEIAGGK